MPKIDPNDAKYESNGERATPCKTGKKLLVYTGFERYYSKNSNPSLMLRFVCVKDYAGKEDEGSEQLENFTLTDKAMFRFVALLKALGVHQPFDSDSDEELTDALLNNRPGVIAELIEEEYNGKKSVKIKSFTIAPDAEFESDENGLVLRSEWDEMVKESEQRHTAYLEWRAKNPRGASAYGGKGGTASRGGGAGQAEDDIPF